MDGFSLDGFGRRRCAGLLAALLCLAAPSPGDAGDLRIFGFFQNAYVQQSRYEIFDYVSPKTTSFSVQQHNLFFQKDVDPSWRAFVNYEFLNSFNSSRDWGSAKIEEAWVRYRADARFNLKLGLSIPVFNNLNQIKNRTPVLPYIVRPLVYESSFEDFIAVEEYLPARAYVQAYGFVPAGDAKLDYALFLGNGPNLNDDPRRGQTGVDTTQAFLVGGRLGVRQGDLKAGVSATRDRINASGPPLIAGGQARRFEKITRLRLGTDLSWLWRDVSFEAEGIAVRYDDKIPGVAFDKEFFYLTLGYRVGERLFVYGSYCRTEEEVVGPQGDLGVLTAVGHVEVPTVGLSYQLRDSIVLKAQFAPVDLDGKGHAVDDVTERYDYDTGFNYLATSVSVVF